MNSNKELFKKILIKVANNLPSPDKGFKMFKSNINYMRSKGLSNAYTNRGNTAPKFSGGSSNMGGLGKYMSIIGKQESANNYKAMGQMIVKGKLRGERALGKYQFMPSTLKGLGYKGSTQQFLNTPALQDQYMKKLTTKNMDYLKGKGIKFDINNPQHQSWLAMGHYAGIGNVPSHIRGKNVGFNNAVTTTGTVHPSVNAYANKYMNSYRQLGR